MVPKGKKYRQRLIVTLLLLIVGAIGLKAILVQDEQFTGTVETFPAELTALIGDLNDNDKDFVKYFAQFWLSDTISADIKPEIINTANHILPILPESKLPLLNYIRLLVDIFHDDYALSQYPVWNRAFDSLLIRPKTTLNDYSQFIKKSKQLFLNTQLESNLSFSWKALPPKSYRLKFEKGELIALFDRITLVCYAKKDSIYIENTSGRYNLIRSSWSGNRGKVTWVRSGYPVDQIYATINRYRLNLRQNSYKIDSAYLVNKDYFTEPIMGKLEDKLLKSYTPHNIDYPRFYTYKKWFKLKDLFKDVDYEGGYIMKGSQLVGVGSTEKLARITVRRNGKPFFTANGKIMLFERTLLKASKASVCFNFGTDSIYHHGLLFIYNDKTRKVILAPTQKITTQSPFYSSYHRISIWTDQLTWNVDSSKLTLSAATGSARGFAEFESENFYNEQTFESIMGIAQKHPLLEIWNYSVRNKQKKFIAEAFARHIRKPVEEVRIEMMRLAKQGYLLYDTESDEVTIINKLRHTIYSRFGKVDYDVIKFSSTCASSTPNAILNFKDMKLTVNGTSPISISTSQNVYIKPKNNRIVMGQNRNFTFSGNLQSGLFHFTGDNFLFNYEQFKITIKDAEIMQLDYKSNKKDRYGRRIIQSIASTFNNINGEVLIDKPNNKSGQKANPDYPIFKSTDSSYVYYDAPSIYNGIYKRDSFYFKLYPFTYVNMDNFEQKDLNFRGMFYSGNIIAPFEENLVLRPDNSLGFVSSIPPEGVALYRGKGRAFNKIDLSNRGLQINGKIRYITSTTESEQLYLFPDSMVTRSTAFSIDKRTDGIEFPNLRGGQHNIRWLPKQDKLFIAKGKQPFTMYDSLARFSGRLLLQPIGLTGTGSITIPNANLAANQFEFMADNFTTPKASLEILRPQSDAIALQTQSVKADINFKTRESRFDRIDTSIFASLNELRYQTYTDNFIWDMSRHQLTFRTPLQQEDVLNGKFTVSRMYDRDSIPMGSLFYSTRQPEDTLYFFSPEARYNIQTNRLEASKVKYILVADATIIPRDSTLRVDGTKRMEPLTGAFIKLKNHRIFDANITIGSRKFYKGTGTFHYVDSRDSLELINLTNIAVDPQLLTYAEGTITKPDRFMLSPYFRFMGKVKLQAEKQNLTFIGGAKPLYSCPKSKGQWVKFESEIDPKNVRIPVGLRPKNLNLYPLISGTVISGDSIKAYGGLLRNRKFHVDKPLVWADGLMYFNENNQRFTIEPEYKISHPDTSGNSVSLQKNYCWVFGDGVITLPVDLGRVKINAYGTTIQKLKENEISLSLMLKVDFLMNKQSLMAMASSINESVTLKKVDLTQKLYRKAIYHFVDTSELSSTLHQISLFGAPTETPKGLKSTITFAYLNMRWDPVNQSFVSKGKLGIGSIDGIEVNRFVDGYIEIFKERFKSYMTLYIHLGDNNYYLFSYYKNSMEVNSTNTGFIEPVKKQRKKERRIKAKGKEPAYRYLVGTVRNVIQAKKRYQQLITGNADTPSKPSESAKTDKDNP